MLKSLYKKDNFEDSYFAVQYKKDYNTMPVIFADDKRLRLCYRRNNNRKGQPFNPE